MTITIYEGHNKTYISLGSNDVRFANHWGVFYRVPVSNLYKELSDITSWANNELGEECLFEVD